MARLIALEGIDGSGKGTQAARLQAHLQQRGLTCALVSFPRYQETRFGRQIGAFLNGRFGALEQVHPVLVSLLFAGDRLESRPFLLDALARHDVVVCDRYVASNMAHQGAKAHAAEREDVLRWIEFVEFELYQLPRADLVLWLDVPVATAQELISRKSRRTYTDAAADLQEADGEYLAAVRAVYDRLAAVDGSWRRISGTREERLRNVDDIAAEIARTVDDWRAGRPSGAAGSGR